jgi:predicted RNA-binding protein YlqC (UPF0109 family)
MTNEEQRAGAILERLILSLLDHPRELDLIPEVLKRRINWGAKVNINDAGKLLGIRGAHFKALRHVVGRMGDRLGSVWTLAFIDPDDGPRGKYSPDVPPPLNFSPTADLHLLAEVLTACTGQTYAIASDPDGGAAWAVRITPRDWEAQEALVDKQASDGEALVAVLGTLFRAIGRRQGVGYRVETSGANP